MLDVDGCPVMEKSGVSIFEFKFIAGYPKEEIDAA
jgi:hypothetical protein